MLALSACAAPRPVPPPVEAAARDTISRDTMRTAAPAWEPPPRPLPERTEVRLPPGTGAAIVGFGRVLPDAEVQALLREYDVRPFGVYLMVGGHGVLEGFPAESASAELLAEARHRRLRMLGPFPCALLADLRQALRDEPAVRPAPGDRYPAGRFRLGAILLARDVRERLSRGDPAVFGLKVVGSQEALRRLAGDPRIVELRPGAGGTREEDRIALPASALLPDHRPALPEVEALSGEEVRARLERLAADPYPECRDELRTADAASADPVRPRPAADGAVMAGGLAFRAATRVDTARDGQMRRLPRVHAVVTVTNPTARRIETSIRRCPVLLRAYATAERTRPAFDAGRGMACGEEPAALSLTPGESRDFETETEVWRVLRDSLPPGPYHFTVLFPLADRTLELPAGQAVLSHGLRGLGYRVRTAVARDSLLARAVVVNEGPDTVHLEFGTCALKLRAYRAAERAGPPVWRSERVEPWSGGGVYGCDLKLGISDLAPGDSLRPFEVRVPLIEVLGDSLPDGRYHFGAVLELNFAETGELAAGAAELAVPRAPLPDSRQARLITYRAATEVTEQRPTRVRTRVTATLTAAGGSIQRYPHGCPVMLWAYRDRARRDAAPVSGAPDWMSHPGGCGPELQEVSLGRGESRVFEVAADARSILGASLPPGRYYFAAVVNAPTRRVFLSAGEADLAP